MQDLVSLSLRNLTTHQQRVKLLQSHGPSITQECLLLAVLTSLLQWTTKPLLGILNDRDTSNMQNPRLQPLKEGTFFGQFKIVCNPEKWHRGTDAVSRNPAPETKTFVSRIFITNKQVDNFNTNHDTIFETLLVAHLEKISNGAITADHDIEAYQNVEQ